MKILETTDYRTNQRKYGYKNYQEHRVGTVAYVCNPSYLGGGDWEDFSPMPAKAKM
jgi:hypothetical protein